MEAKRQRHITLACRFLPYDQWFLTHVDPTWKIRHLKQIILAKCLALPFDARKLARDTLEGGSPPSPITFAPDETLQEGEPASPIKFAGVVKKKRSVGVDEEEHVRVEDAVDDPLGAPGEEGYEEDDEWDGQDEEDDDENDLASTGPPTTSGRIQVPVQVDVQGKSGGRFPSSSVGGTPGPQTTSTSFSPPQFLAQVHKDKDDDDEQIQTAAYTLVRFSTGQILEEEFKIFWCDLAEQELVELHASSGLDARAIPAFSEKRRSEGQEGFFTTLHLSAILTSPVPPPLPSDSHKKDRLRGLLSPHHLHSSSPFSLASHSLRLTLTQLPRHDLTAYIQPYWEGWVRALRVVWPSDPRVAAAPAPAPGGSMQDYGASMMNFSGGMNAGMALWVMPDVSAMSPSGRSGYRQIPGDAGEGKDAYMDTHGGGRVKSRLEWRERWVVIRDGVISLCKTRDDPTPTHNMPLSGLLALRDAGHLASSIHNNTRPPARTVAVRASSPSLHSHTRSVGDGLRDGGRERVRQQGHEHRRSTSAPRSSVTTTSTTTVRGAAASMPDSTDVEAARRQQQYLRAPDAETAAEREARHHRQQLREKQREKERERERERRRHRVGEQRELEYLRNWDDIGISFGRKDKMKEKEREREREKEREKKQTESREKKERERREKERMDSRGKERIDSRGKDKERGKESEKGKERDIGIDDRQRLERSRGSRTYIPTSKHDAEAAGMKIVCAKFKTLRPPATTPPQPQPALLKYTSTGPSLADVDVDPPSIVHKIAAVVTDELTLSPQQPPRKGSLPNLPGLSKLGATPPSFPPSSSPAASSLAVSTPSVAAVHPSPVPSSSAPKFAIGGLFGKVGEASEKDEKKREEKERKAREKEQKALEKEQQRRVKEREKARRKEKEETADEDDFGQSSSRSWKIGKRRPTPGKAPVRDRVETDRDSSVDLLAPPVVRAPATLASAASSSTLLPEDAHPSFYSTSLNDDDSTRYAPSVLLATHDYHHPHAASSPSSSRPKLTIHPVDSPSVPSLSPSKDNHNDKEKEGHLSEQSPDSSSLSLSSPVFAHSTDDMSEDDLLDDDQRGLPGLGSGVRKDRKGYRYGGYHLHKAEREKVASVMAGPAEQKDGASARGQPSPQRNPKLKEMDKGKGKEKDHERGEWIVLDMGNDHAFNSILRIFHRYFEQPITSSFVPTSLTSAHPPTTTSLNANPNPALIDPSSNHPVSNTSAAPSTAGSRMPSAINSPVQPHFPASSAQAQHPPILSPPLSPLTSSHPHLALAYPEWRHQVVQRARSHGMREAGRPLDFALAGWGAGMVWDEEEEARRVWTRKRDEGDGEGGAHGYGYGYGGAVGETVQEEDEEGYEEDAVEREDAGQKEERRRMSQASRVSTINAVKANTAAAAAGATGEVIDETDEHEHDAGSVQWANYASSSGYAGDNAPTPAYDEDEEGPLVFGMESLMDDSEGESEAEWVAWVTDLPRQARVREEQARQQKDLEVELEKELERERQAGQQNLPALVPLSPMVFSNPFSDVPPPSAEEPPSAHAQTPLGLLEHGMMERRTSALSTLSSRHAQIPKSQEEERRRFVEGRRMLEPSAVSRSYPPPPQPPTEMPPPSHGQVQGDNVELVYNGAAASAFAQRPSFSRLLPTQIHVHAETHVQGSSISAEQNPQFRSRFPVAIWSPPSIESLSRSPWHGGPPTSISVPSTSNTLPSPFGTFSPGMESSDLDGYVSVVRGRDLDPLSSATTPPSSGYAKVASQRQTSHHSRTASGSAKPHLPPIESMDVETVVMSMPSTVTTPAYTATPPVSMPILTQAQIHEIETETELRMLSRVPPTSSSPSYSSFIPVPVSRRSSTTGMSPSASGSPPYMSSMHMNTGSGLIGRSSPAELSERGVLKKTRSSDIGSDTSPEAKSSKQRPKLSLPGIGASGSSSQDMQPAYQQRQRMRSPTTSAPVSSYNPAGGASAGTSGSGSNMASARALLRRVRSGSSLRLDIHQEERVGALSSGPPVPMSPKRERERTREVSPSPAARKKKGTIERIVRGLDSALEFVEGK